MSTEAPAITESTIQTQPRRFWRLRDLTRGHLAAFLIGMTVGEIVIIIGALMMR